MEGVMMRGKHTWAVAARDPQGLIHSEEYPLTSAAAKNAWMRWPLVRGVVALVESLVLGTRALTISARLAELDASDATSPPDAATDTGEGAAPQGLSSAAIAGSVVIGAAAAIALFILLPAVLTNLIVGSADKNLAVWNIVDGVLRVVAFFAYVALIGRIPDIKRVFAYHGAEHKVIHTVEHGEALTPQNARKYPRLHVRCGTAFLIMVMALAILVFSLIPVRAMVDSWGITNPAAKLALVIASRLLLMPLVAGLAYEINVKWAGPRADFWLVKILLWPGLQMQRLTTSEPDDSMLEVAIRSTELVRASDTAREKQDKGSERVHSGDTPALPAEYDLLDDAL
jgi:uncharacterized protein YqhQ